LFFDPLLILEPFLSAAFEFLDCVLDALGWGCEGIKADTFPCLLTLESSLFFASPPKCIGEEEVQQLVVYSCVLRLLEVLQDSKAKETFQNAKV
jgi:hypothetical protein